MPRGEGGAPPARRLLLAVLCGVVAGAAAGCAGVGGDGGEAERALGDRIATERADAAREARLEERVRQLERERAEDRRERERERRQTARRDLKPSSGTVTHVVTTPPASPAPAAAAGSTASAGHVVQLGSYATRPEAEAQAAALRSRGLSASVLHSDDYPQMRAGWWVPYLGFFATSAQAEGAALQAREAGIGDAFARYVAAG